MDKASTYTRHLEKVLFSRYNTRMEKTGMQRLPTPLAIGHRIQLARDIHHMSQADLAVALGVSSHQSISELEKGNRQLQPGELAKLARALGQGVDYFIDPFSVKGEAKYSWRRSPSADKDPPAEIQSRIDRMVGLLRWLRSLDDDAASVTRQVLCLSDCSTFEEAERAGDRLARDLKLGPVPSRKLLDKMESELDVPVLFVSFGSGPQAKAISGATVHLSNLNCILINRNEPAGRRSFDLAHELFHVMTWDALPPEKVESNEVGSRGTAKKDRTEQLADKFASALLLPAELLYSKFEGVDKSDVSELLELSKYFGVSASALAFRLLSLKLIDQPTCNKLKSKRISVTEDVAPKQFSETFVTLLAEAFLSGRLSPRKAATVLGLNLDDLDALLRDWGRPDAIEF
jgi:Zn-dependent peptidase ImmA (M78 family)/transcriptional regulator with XRE-family HTH domain